MNRLTRGAILLAAFATVDASASTWGAQTTITGYYVYDSGAAFITTANNQNPDNCATSAYLYLNTTAPNFGAIWATVISAQATGSTVTVYYNGCNSSGYPLVSAVVVPHIW
jgi:hypothetical protein